MVKEQGIQPLKTTLFSLIETLLRFIVIDTSINIKKILMAIVCSLFALLLAIFVWILCVYFFSMILLAHGVHQNNIFIIDILVNIVFMALCITMSYRQFSKIQFTYSSAAFSKVKKAFGAHNEIT